jgi:hypothetical protein
MQPRPSNDPPGKDSCIIGASNIIGVSNQNILGTHGAQNGAVTQNNVTRPCKL